jgi:predicted small metal-binding protein
MKTMTCKQLGGPCDAKLSAESWDEMVQNMVKHVYANHPQTAEEMKKMHDANATRISLFFELSPLQGSLGVNCSFPVGL